MIEFIKNKLSERFKEKKILILGFGKEGRSTYKWLRLLFLELPLTIADQNKSIIDEENLKSDERLQFILGKDYLESIHSFDLVIKSPGISLKNLEINPSVEITSQTDLFLYLFHNQTIGVTGTKGKSTTVSLIYHLILKQHSDCMLVGNIGIPAFEVFDKITKDSLIVYELSSHQLQNVNHSPFISILLNLFEEHLDHYNSYLEYQKSKFNIAKFQKSSDSFIYHKADLLIQNLVSTIDIKSNLFTFGYQNADATLNQNGIELLNHFLEINFNDLILKGKHNFLNVCAALLVCKRLKLNIDKAVNDLKTFQPLEHRMEFFLKCKEISFYNDSISTIPEACIQAIETIPKVGTLILGGYDRGIEYQLLIDYLKQNPIENVLLIGKVGEILFDKLKEIKYTGKYLKVRNLDEIVELSFKLTSPGKSCLLSPAASSYDMFKNFEERGSIFKQKVRQYCLTLSQ